MVRIFYQFPFNGGRMLQFSLILSFLLGCANSSGVNHGFGFDIANFDPDIEILDFRYGSDATLPTRATEEEIRLGKVPRQTFVRGNFKVGNDLDVRWRKKGTGEIFSKKVELKGLLPSDMEEKELHFTIVGEALYVAVLISELHEKNMPDCPMPTRKKMKCRLIYPFFKQNY